MKLIVASRWAEKYFEPGSRPDLRTVRAWIASGEVPGKVIGKRAYVDEQSWLDKPATGDVLVDRVENAAAPTRPPLRSSARRGDRDRRGSSAPTSVRAAIESLARAT